MYDRFAPAMLGAAGGAAGPSRTLKALGAAGPSRTLTVIVPTRNEAENVGPLVKRIAAAVEGIDAEVLFVDDSDDNTPGAVRATAEAAPLPVRLLHRSGAERVNGLGGAVAAGLSATDATWVVVMDGDLQHPPETIPALLRQGNNWRLDVVVASRYVGVGGADGLASPSRRLVSSAATCATKCLFPRRLRQVSDPMSGFFALRRNVVEPAALRPRGFKILLEILARTDAVRVGEVPFRFAERHGGASKATAAEGLRFVRQLVGMRLAGSRQWMTTFAKFGTVGATGVLVNLTVLRLMLAAAMSAPLAATVAAQVAIGSNYLLTEAWVFRSHRPGRSWGRALSFWSVSTGALAVQLPLAALIAGRTPLDYVQATGLALVVLMALRFVVFSGVVYSNAGQRAQPRVQGDTREIVIDLREGHLRVKVHDDSPVMPQLRPPSSDATSGRGMAIVDGLPAA